MKKRLIIFLTTILILSSMALSKNQIDAFAGTDNTESDNTETVLMDTPSFKYYKSDDAVDNKNQPMNLKLKSSKANKITDDDAWFEKNKLSLKTYVVPSLFTRGNLPDGIDEVWEDLSITSAFYDTSYIYCTYGVDFSEGYILNIYNSKTLDLAYSLDFSNYRYSPDYIEADYNYIQQKINWAAIKDNVLYVSHSHSTYAKSSKNMNAYITAIDLSDMSILWRTKSLVSNSYNFIIVDDVIVCGYGFTGERDYLYQIDLYTGKVLNKTSVKSKISYIVKKGNSLYVRTYNTDYKFDIVK